MKKLCVFVLRFLYDVKSFKDLLLSFVSQSLLICSMQVLSISAFSSSFMILATIFFKSYLRVVEILY